jgi:hypothetical protein
MRERFGKNELDAALAEAENAGVIYVDKSYWAGDHSRKYCIGATYWNDAVSEYTITTPHIIAAEKRFLDKHYKDEKTAYSWIENQLWKDLQLTEIDTLSPEEILFYSDYETDKNNNNTIAYNKIQSKQFFLNVCPYGRVHTNNTNIQSGMRQHLTLAGERVIKLDVKNCQVLLNVNLISQYLGGIPNLRQGRGKPTHSQTTTPYVGNWVDGEIQTYRKDCEDGLFYDKAMPFIGKSRKETKHDIIVFLFGKLYEGKVKDYFQLTYPTIYQMLVEVKKFDYKLLSHELQKLESTIMINGACRRFKERYPDTPIISIHDCLAVPESFGAARLESIILESFDEYGLHPQIEKE